MMKLLIIILFVIVACIPSAVSRNNWPYYYCRLKCPLFDPISSTVHLPGPTKRHFYKCQHGVGILFACGQKLHFNPKLQVCDWPRRARAVVCKGSPNQNVEGSGDGYWTNPYH